MGRHATVAGRMAASSQARGKLFTKLAREIMVSARAGSDLATNSPLRIAVNKAKANSMPKENIERAIKKGSGEASGATYEEIVYEAYGPGGAAILIRTLTDNRNRTNPELRVLLQKNNGRLAEMGSVAWMFERKGVLTVSGDTIAEETLMEAAIDAGAADVVRDEGVFVVYTEVADFSSVREKLGERGITFSSADLEFVPTTQVELSEDDRKMADLLLEKIEDYDDVQNVYTNFN